MCSLAQGLLIFRIVKAENVKVFETKMGPRADTKEINNYLPPRRKWDSLAAKLREKMEASAYLYTSVIVAFSECGLALGSTISEKLKIPLFELCIEPLSTGVNGVVYGAVIGKFDFFCINDQVVHQSGLTQDAVLEQLQNAKRAALMRATSVGERLWFHNRHRFRDVTIFLIDGSMVSSEVVTVALQCLQDHEVRAIIPVAGYLYKPALAEVPPKVATGIYLEQFKDLGELAERVCN